jgi:hypothetical protein
MPILALTWISGHSSRLLLKQLNKLLRTMFMFLGVSSLAGGHKTLIPQVINELKKIWEGRYTCNCRRSDPSPGLSVSL